MTPRIVLCLPGNHHSISVLNYPLLPLVVYLWRTTSRKKGVSRKKRLSNSSICLGVKMYFFISTLKKQLRAFAICLFIYHHNQRGQNNQLSQGLDVTIETAVYLSLFYRHHEPYWSIRQQILGSLCILFSLNKRRPHNNQDPSRFALPFSWLHLPSLYHTGFPPSFQ